MSISYLIFATSKQHQILYTYGFYLLKYQIGKNRCVLQFCFKQRKSSKIFEFVYQPSTSKFKSIVNYYASLIIKFDQVKTKTAKFQPTSFVDKIMLSKEREKITSKSFNNKSNLESKHLSFSILSALQLYFNKLESLKNMYQ